MKSEFQCDCSVHLKAALHCQTFQHECEMLPFSCRRKCEIKPHNETRSAFVTAQLFVVQGQRPPLLSFSDLCSHIYTSKKKAFIVFAASVALIILQTQKLSAEYFRVEFNEM